MQPTRPADIPYTLFGQMEQGAPLQGLPNNGAATEDKSAMQDLTTAYITTMYYSALANLYLQSILPEDGAKVDEEMPRVKIAVERSHADYMAASKWLTENGKEFIGTSPAKQYYDELLGTGIESIKDTAAVYSDQN